MSGDDAMGESGSRVYGSCEGPEAMYVKLISSDGHEFIVKRDHALTSGTIKAMLSGPGQFRYVIAVIQGCWLQVLSLNFYGIDCQPLEFSKSDFFVRFEGILSKKIGLHLVGL